MDKADEKNYNKGRRWLSKKQRERKGAGLPQAPTEQRSRREGPYKDNTTTTQTTTTPFGLCSEIKTKLEW